MLVQQSGSAWIMPDGELYKTSFHKGSMTWKDHQKCVSEVCPSRRFLDPPFPSPKSWFCPYLWFQKTWPQVPVRIYVRNSDSQLVASINKRSLKKYVDWSVDPCLKFYFVFGYFFSYFLEIKTHCYCYCYFIDACELCIESRKNVSQSQFQIRSFVQLSNFSSWKHKILVWAFDLMFENMF